MKKYNSAIILLLLPIILALLACGKKESEDQVNSSGLKEQVVELLDSSSQEQALLKKLPANTLAYGFVDLENPKYQSFLKSPFNKFTNLPENYGQAPSNPKLAGKSQTIQKILSKFNDPEGKNILSLYRQTPDRVSHYLFFISGNTAQDLTYNVFAYAKDKNYFINNFDKLSQDVITSGLPLSVAPAEQKIGSISKSFTIPETNSNLHLIADEQHLAISSSESTASRLFTTQEPSDQFDIKTSLTKELQNDIAAQPIVFAVANLERILQLVPGVGLINPKYKHLLNLIPRQALLTSDFNTAPESKISFYIPETGLPVNLQGVFANSSAKAWDTFSASTFLAFDLNLGFIKKILNFVKTDVLDPTKPIQIKQLNDVIAHLPDNGELGVALTNFNITGFPDLQLSVPVSNAPEKIALLKSLIASQKSTGMAETPWQEKLIAEQPAEYMVTPFGVGLYINSTGDLVRIGTSETALKELIAPTATLLNSLDPKLKFAPKNAISSFYLDYAKLYRVAQSFRSMMAMFIPPDQNTQVDSVYKKLEELKNLVLFADSSYQNDILKIEFNLQTMTPSLPQN